MMMHPGRDALLAYVDGEMAPHEDGGIAGHEAACARCDAVIRELRDDALLFADALRTLDAAEPASWVSTAREHGAGSDALRVVEEDAVTSAGSAEARLDGVVLLPAGHGQVTMRPSRVAGVLRWAAGILLLAGATTYGAVVGVRAFSERDPEPVPLAQREAAEPEVAAVMVAPADGALRVAVMGVGSGSRIFVTFDDRTDASVAVEGADSPRFTAVDGRVDVDLGSESATLRVTLPRGLRTATVTAEGRTVVSVEGGRVSPTGASAGIPLDGGGGTRME